MNYKSNVVKKPWGYEYLAYENDKVALWFLKILRDHRTSTHCHPNKTTGLMVVDGHAEVSFLADSINLKNSEKIMIRKGLFHSTKACQNHLSLFEIETPVDKHDLVRLHDSYGRTGQPYEDETYEYPKESECVWIKDPLPGESETYNFDGQSIKVISVQTLDHLKEISRSSNVMFLKGGLLTEYGVAVASPGDIVSSNVLQRLLDVFNKVDEGTIVLIHEGE
jgi:mannose-6-phosphate isomerase-like protein (cupin superfamily)